MGAVSPLLPWIFSGEGSEATAVGRKLSRFLLQALPSPC